MLRQIRVSDLQLRSMESQRRARLTSQLPDAIREINKKNPNQEIIGRWLRELTATAQPYLYYAPMVAGGFGTSKKLAPVNTIFSPDTAASDAELKQNTVFLSPERGLLLQKLVAAGLPLKLSLDNHSHFGDYRYSDARGLWIEGPVAARDDQSPRPCYQSHFLQDLPSELIEFSDFTGATLHFVSMKTLGARFQNTTFQSSRVFISDDASFVSGHNRFHAAYIVSSLQQALDLIVLEAAEVSCFQIELEPDARKLLTSNNLAGAWQPFAQVIKVLSSAGKVRLPPSYDPNRYPPGKQGDCALTAEITEDTLYFVEELGCFN